MTSQPRQVETLSHLGISKAGAEILRYFLARPEAAPHTRELQRVLALGGRSVQRELERLVELGVLERVKDQRFVRHRIVASSPVWRAIQQLAAASSDPAPLLRTALADVRGIDGAFLFGSAAKRTAVRPGADIDVFIIEGPDLDRAKLYRQLSEIALLLDREVNTVRYTPDALLERTRDPSHPAHPFVQHALSRSKRWLAGGPSAMSRSRRTKSAGSTPG